MAKREVNQEILRSSFTCDGIRIFMTFDAEAKVYRVATRWVWLAAFDSVWDACDAFEAMELMGGADRHLASLIKQEIKRVPRYRASKWLGMERVNSLIDCAVRRLSGLRPQSCGRKASVVRWIPA